ncbi:uncharacterized protein [Anabrus simplex]|uniref:uncharacterized protein n=1 Tax=Anabrus simplex TaxID=316456 RepID=UPI0035A37AD6
MESEVMIKQEPICFKETSNTSCDNYKIISEEMHLKEEPKSELAEPRETQPSTDIKDEICIDEQTVGQSVDGFKEDDKFELTARGEGESCGVPFYKFGPNVHSVEKYFETSGLGLGTLHY